MNTIRIEEVDHVNVRVLCDDLGTRTEISEHFTHFSKAYKFHPAYKSGRWDGKLRLFNAMQNLLPRGLLEDLLKFASERGYETVVDPSLEIQDEVSQKELKALYDANIRQEGIYPRDYQDEAVSLALNEKRKIILSPTASGKSLICYLLCCYAKQHGLKTILIVPRGSLVRQMKGDFEDYSNDQLPFSVKRMPDDKKMPDDDADVIITTWQSAVKKPKEWFHQFGMIIGDEVHSFEAKSLVFIMSNLINSEYRIGLTGTIEDTKTTMLSLKGMFGSISKVTSAVEQMEKGNMSDLLIYVLVLKYSDADRKELNRLKKEALKSMKPSQSKGMVTYNVEMDYIIEHEGRNKFLLNLQNSLNKNTLTLFYKVDTHGKMIYNRLLKYGKKRPHFIHGGIPVKKREEIRLGCEESDDNDIVASYETFKMGVNIKRLTYAIFGSPSKGEYRVVQSIGRLLRKYDDSRAELFDIVDDFSTKSSKNHCVKQMEKRLEIYNREGYKYKIVRIDL